MYAIIRDGGKQYKVSEGDIVDLERRDVSPNDEIDLKDVLLVSDAEGGARLGSPTLDGAVVKATVLGEVRGKKIYVIKYKRRKGYRRKTGHRQNYIRVRISKILESAPVAEPVTEAETEPAPVEA